MPRTLQSLDYLVAQTFGRWTVESEVPYQAYHRRRLLCICTCGTRREVRQDHLLNGKTLSCGCLLVESATRHGHARPGFHSPEYDAWLSMRKRCLNTTNKAYRRYGGRGITVCDRWIESFETFLSDVGTRPSDNHSLDRIDNDGNYEPGNVRWANDSTQNRNKRINRMLTVNGRTQGLMEWSEEVNIAPHVLRNRLKDGWDHEKTVMTPVEKRKPRVKLELLKMVG